ncbi:MAG: four helix bundle protein [Thermomicrobiales bacterium]|nr:MAG: four helix bundle protein [Thermomicrobiales bacterium]
MDLAETVYRMTWRFSDREKYSMSNQLQRAALSVPSNIAEGHARGHTNDFIRFLSIARGSLAEVETNVSMARRLGYLSEDEKDQLFAQSDDLGRQLTALRSAIERRVDKPKRLAEEAPPPYS